MIELFTLTDSTVAQGQLLDGATAYIDADWISSGRGATAALVVSLDGNVSWAGDPSSRVQADGETHGIVGRILFQIVEEAAAVVADVPRELIDVQGRGLIAAWIRDRLEIVDCTRQSTSERRPQAVVDLTGDPDAILSATRVVEDLGVVVLAGRASSVASIDLYSDIHARCLRVVGVSPPLDQALAAECHGLGRMVRRIREVERIVRRGEPLPADALLYRLSN